MKAFLLSAGLGTRLRPLTEHTPKCLLPINGKPLLQIWLEHLERNGVCEVLVNTHWHYQQVESSLASWQGALRVTPFYEPVLLGSAGTLLANKDWVSDGNPFYILYGDNLTDVDLSRMLVFHEGHGMPFTLGVFKAEHPNRCGIAEVDEAGVVTAFVEKPDNPKSDMAAAGVYIADSRIFDFFPRDSFCLELPLDLGFHVIPRLAGNMKAYPLKEFLLDIGTPESYELAQRAWPGR